MGQHVLIEEWAKGPNGFKYPISKGELRTIAKSKQTYPPAKKQGRKWVIDEDAKFIGMVEKPEIPQHVQPGKVKSLMEKVLNGKATQT